MRNEDASKVRAESREYEDRNAFEDGAHFGYRLGVEAENERLILFTEASQQSTEELKKAAGQIAAERDYYKELAEQADKVIEFRKTEPPIRQDNFSAWVEQFKPIMKRYEELKSKADE